MRSVFGVWSNILPSQLNRLLRPYNIRLVLKYPKPAAGDQVLVTVEPIAPKEATLPDQAVS